MTIESIFLSIRLANRIYQLYMQKRLFFSYGPMLAAGTKSHSKARRGGDEESMKAYTKVRRGVRQGDSKGESMKAAWYEKMADRSHLPPELERISVLEFREVFFKAYRITYQIIGNNVYVHCILDGRRDMQDSLQQRVLR
jgi:hypothetical protein